MPKLSRDQQDAIMVPLAVAYRELHRQVTGHYPPESEGTNDEILRDGLRLDDPVLVQLVEQKERSGQPWGPWRTATYKGREGAESRAVTSPATMDSIARKYGG